MKRVKTAPHKLKNAKDVSWKAEFPEDIWRLIIDALPVDNEWIHELSVMISLVSTSKMLLRLMKPMVLKLLDGQRLFDASYTETRGTVYRGKALLFRSVHAVYQTCNVSLSTYISRCLTDKEHQSAEHLSTCLSLFQLAYLEGRLLYRSQWHYTAKKYVHTYQPISKLESISAFYRLRQVRYFDANRKKASCLNRLKHITVIEMSTFKSLIASQMLSLYPEDVAMINKQDMSSERLAHYMEVLQENGISFKTRKATAHDHLINVIVSIDDRQYCISSDAASDLRRQCFLIDTGFSAEEATCAYLLDYLHTRNWDIVRSILSDNARA